MADRNKTLSDSIFAWSLDDLPHSSKEGYSAFNALAGFAVAQGVALTAVAKGEGRTFLVLSIYAAAVVLTIAWTSKLLKLTRTETNHNGAVETVRAFDNPSIQHGRFTLAWILVVSVVLIALGLLGLLPNQVAREYFVGDIKLLTPALLKERESDRFAGIAGSAIDRQTLDLWLSWLNPKGETGTLLWLQQAQPFPAHQKSINVELTFDPQVVTVSKRVAFLVKADGDSIRPVLRQMSFVLSPPDFDQSNRLELVDPDPGETLLVICVVDVNDGKRIEDGKFAIERR